MTNKTNVSGLFYAGGGISIIVFVNSFLVISCHLFGKFTLSTIPFYLIAFAAFASLCCLVSMFVVAVSDNDQLKNENKALKQKLLEIDYDRKQEKNIIDTQGTMERRPSRRKTKPPAQELVFG